MHIRIGDLLISPSTEPVVFVFENDEERQGVANQIGHMEQRHGIRAYAQFPDSYSTEYIEKYMKESIQMVENVG